MHIRLALGVVQEKCAFLRRLFASLGLLPGVKGPSFHVKTKVGSPFGQQFCTQNWMKSSAMMTSDPALRLHLASLRFIIFGQHRSKQTFVSSSSSRERHRRAWITVTSLRWLTCVYLFPLVLALLAGSTRWSHVSKTESFFSRYFLFISRSTLSTCQ